jgi:hypothetical protein
MVMSTRSSTTSLATLASNSAMATACPWPYPQTYAQAPNHLPVLTVPMNRADPFFERDATGWPFIDIHSGKVAMNYTLNDNTNRLVAFNTATGRPEDRGYQPEGARIPHRCITESNRPRREFHAQESDPECSPAGGIQRNGPARPRG